MTMERVIPILLIAIYFTFVAGHLRVLLKTVEPGMAFYFKIKLVVVCLFWPLIILGMFSELLPGQRDDERN